MEWSSIDKIRWFLNEGWCARRTSVSWRNTCMQRGCEISEITSTSTEIDRVESPKIYITSKTAFRLDTLERVPVIKSRFKCTIDVDVF